MNNQYPYPFNFPFPQEVSLLIFSHLDGKELVKSHFVSTKFKETVENNALWRAIASKEGIPFSCHFPAKQQVKEYCCRFTQLFCSIFPQKQLPKNWFERYSVMKAFVESSKGRINEAEVIQKTLDGYIETATITTEQVPEKIRMLIQAGGNFNKFLYSPIYKVIDKIKSYAMRDSDVYKKHQFISRSPLSTEERQELMHLLQILEAFVEGKGKITRSNESLSLAKIALKYKFYALAKNLIIHHIQNTLGIGTLEHLLFSIIEKRESYLPEELIHIKEIIEILLKAGVQPSFALAEKLNKIILNS